ncbi:MAG: CoA ester lyase [Candidatus Bathyarchaeia archaeon]|jgi:citrate lyase subunit beta/citryl-CoA lyase
MALLRSILYFPANSVRMIVKAATLPTDAVIFDLEDAVPLDDKENARGIARDYIGLIKKRGIQTFVRVNSLTTGLTVEDIQSTAVKELDGVMLAKTEAGSDVTKLSKILDRVERKERIASKSIKLIPLIESTKGVVNSLQIASSNRRVIAVAFGAGDYYRDLGRDISQISNDEVELLYARSTIVNTGRAVGIQAIDTPFLGSLTDREAFLREVRIAVQLGFKGKQCIHPSQIEPINTLFSPSQNEIDHAGRIVKAFEEAQARGLGAISFEGKMIDNMTYRQAKDTLAAAELITAKTTRGGYVSISEIFAAPQR